LYKQNWLQFLFVVKATTLKQQISKFYPQILCTEASRYISISHKFQRQLLCIEFADKILTFFILAVSKQWITANTN